MYRLLRLDHPSRLHRLARRFARFGLVGLSGVGVNLGVFWLCTERLGLHYLLAGAIAIETALCNNYLLNNNWTFRDRRSGFLSIQGLVRYHAVSFGGMLINLAVLHVLVVAADLVPIAGNLAGIAVATSWNFSLNLLWTWRRPQRRLERQTPGGTQSAPVPAGRTALSPGELP